MKRPVFGYLFGLGLLAWASLATQAAASQGSGCMPTTGTVSGLTLVQDINAGLAALISSNSGATAPATDCTALAIKGQLWLDTSTTPNHLRVYDGATTWLDLGAIDAVTHLWTPVIGGGTATIASASTVDLCSSPQASVTVSGVVTVTSFSNTCATGSIKALTFSGVLTLTYNAGSMILPGAANIITQAGDRALATYLGSGNWALFAYTRADGTPVSSSSVFTGAVFFAAPITITLGSNTNDWAPTGLATANVIHLTCSSAISITGLTAPATDGKVLSIDNAGGTNTCTFTAQDASSSAANRFAMDRPIAMRPGRTLAFRYDASASRWRLWQEVTAQPVAGGFKNLRVFNVATYFGDSAPATPNSQMKIVVDEIMVEDGTGGAARLSNVTCTIVASGNAFSSGSGGLDASALAAGNWYSLWVIYNPTTNTMSCLASLASTLGTITLPSGYTFGVRVGWNYYLTNNAVTGFQRLIQYGRRVQYAVTAATPTNALVQIANGITGSYSPTAPTYAAKTVAAAVPSTAATIFLSISSNYNATGATGFAVAPNNNYSGSNSTNPPPCAQSALTGINGPTSCSFLLESSSIYVAIDSTGGNVAALGWEDNL